jgi:hypothetical protein
MKREIALRKFPDYPFEAKFYSGRRQLAVRRGVLKPINLPPDSSKLTLKTELDGKLIHHIEREIRLLSLASGAQDQAQDIKEQVPLLDTRLQTS